MSALQELHAARRRAWKEGYDACNLGRWPRSCPYPKGSLLWSEWIAGWKRADNDAQPATE